MRIAFVWDWDIVPEQALGWKDGLARAIFILSKRHDVSVFACADTSYTLPHPYFPIHVTNNMKESVELFKPQVIVHWADMTRPNALPLKALGLPMLLCFAGGNPRGENFDLFDHVFVESQSYFDTFQASGKSCSIAFGTNTDLFVPGSKQKKMFDVLFPATYCDWKRHDLLMNACQGLKVCTAGWMYSDHEQYCYEYPQDKGALALNHVTADTLKILYDASKVVVIPSRTDGGSQRTVLEAMAMNIPVVVCGDSDKTSEYVREGGGFIADPNPTSLREAVNKALAQTETNTRPYIMGKWSSDIYAQEIERYASQNL